MQSTQKSTELLAIELLQSHIEKIAYIESSLRHLEKEQLELERKIKEMEEQKMNKPLLLSHSSDGFWKAAAAFIAVAFLTQLSGVWEKVKILWTSIE